MITPKDWKEHKSEIIEQILGEYIDNYLKSINVKIWYRESKYGRWTFSTPQSELTANYFIGE